MSAELTLSKLFNLRLQRFSAEARQLVSVARNETSISRLLPLLRYLGILAARFPTPISQQELAKYARVSNAAVSKLRGRIYPFCEDRVLGRQRKLLLRVDNKVATEAFVAFLLGGKLRLFFGSRYGEAILRKVVHKIYRDLEKRESDLGRFFSEDDALFASRLIAIALSETVDDLDSSLIVSMDANQTQAAMVQHIVAIMDRIGPSIQRQVRDVQTLRKILVVRDNAWYLFLRVIQTKLGFLFRDFLGQLPDSKMQEEYLKVYQQTVVFYARRVLDEQFTSRIEVAAKKNKLKLDPLELEIGHFSHRPVEIPEFDVNSDRAWIGP